MASVIFRSADKSLSIAGKTALKRFVVSLFKKENCSLGSVTYVFCSDEYLLQMNRDFLQHDYYTDIITFGLSGKGEPIDAEIYISIDRVKDNAANLGVSFSNEICRVIFHGALHLCGYKDKRKSEIATMRAKEDQYLSLYQKQVS